MNSTINSTIQVGDVVKFRKVVDAGDADARMKVLEIEADRDWVLIEDICDMRFKGTATYRLSDVVKA